MLIAQNLEIADSAAVEDGATSGVRLEFDRCFCARLSACRPDCLMGRYCL